MTASQLGDKRTEFTHEQSSLVTSSASISSLSDSKGTARVKLTLPNLAQLLQLSKSKVYKLVERGEIPHYRIGSSIRFDPDEIRVWLERHHRPAVSMQDAIAEKEHESERRGVV